MKNGAGGAPPAGRPRPSTISLPESPGGVFRAILRCVSVPTTQIRDEHVLVRMPYVEYDEVGAACSECGRLFRSAEDLEEHRKESHGPGASPREARERKPTLPCSMCSRRFYSVAALQDHTRRDHST